ncbi:MAG: hypothetical protein OXQ94_13535 [Gemmatimonadota bacterium]|nr:hypothetical protein [Gemmatimonadota bacterium]MDE2872696.1 hypothetical protein [Gemmatimonadota bacterium]
MATLLESRAGAAKLGIPLMITSFVMVAGFLFWLSVTAKPTEVVLPDPEDIFENVVSLADFSVDPRGYIGEAVSLEGVRLGERFGNHFRWINLPDAQNNAFLLHWSDSLRADTTIALTTLASGTIVSLSGIVTNTTDSIVEEWSAAGAFMIPVESQVARSTYHLSFLEVTRIKPPDAPRPGQGVGSGSG